MKVAGNMSAVANDRALAQAIMARSVPDFFIRTPSKH
jgi:hypothetical protein